jgi:hypothetical protein
MKRRRNAQPELRPVYVQPTFDSRERAARRDWRNAAYRGPRHRPKPGEFDPLWLRLGLRMSLIDSRAGWVVSNPIFDQSLRRNPQHDPSLPGPGWLYELYRHYAHRDLVLLTGARSAIQRRLDALRAAEESEGAPALPKACPDTSQQSLFSTEGAL